MGTTRRTAAIVVVVALGTFAGACTTTGGGGSGGGGGRVACPTPAAGQIRAAVVVDAVALGSSVPSVVCVVVSAGATGIAALNARAALYGQPAPRFDISGLLCAIDGAPVAPACSDVGPSGIQYWSYWSGGASWTYATTGPATRHLTDGSVEGWRFNSGGADVGPAASPTFAQLVA